MPWYRLSEFSVRRRFVLRSLSLEEEGQGEG